MTEGLLEIATFEELKDLYEGIMKPTDLALEGLWQVRFWDGMDGTWSDHGAALTPHEALKEWFRATQYGEKNTNPRDDVDYFRIFPANTVMAWGSGREMHRGDAPLPEPEPLLIVENKKRRPPWRFDLAAQFVSALEKGLSAVGYHIAMAGSVLHTGESKHDLDVIIYPHDSTKQDQPAARKVLEGYGMKLTHPVDVVHAAWREKGGTDEKHVEVWKWHYYRIDVFFLR